MSPLPMFAAGKNYPWNSYQPIYLFCPSCLESDNFTHEVGTNNVECFCGWSGHNDKLLNLTIEQRDLILMRKQKLQRVLN